MDRTTLKTRNASNTRTTMGKEKNAEESSNGEMSDAGAKLKKKKT